MPKITARRMCMDLIEHQAINNRWGGVGYIEMRTPMMDVGFHRETGKRTIKPRMRKYHETQLMDMTDPATGEKLLYKSGDKKGQVRQQGKPNPFWDFGQDCAKILKVTRQQVQVGFDWEKVLQTEQMRAGLEPDFQAGIGAPTWRKETRYVEIEIDEIKKKTLFFYKLDVNPAGEVLPFNPQRSSIYLACLLPRKPILPFAQWYEEIATGNRIDPVLLEDWLLAEQDEDDIAESQGHPDRPDLNRFMFSPKITNVTALSVFGKRYSMPKRDWGDVNPVNFAEMDEIIMEMDDFTGPDGEVSTGYRKAYTEKMAADPSYDPGRKPRKIKVD